MTSQKYIDLQRCRRCCPWTGSSTCARFTMPALSSPLNRFYLQVVSTVASCAGSGTRRAQALGLVVLTRITLPVCNQNQKEFGWDYAQWASLNDNNVSVMLCTPPLLLVASVVLVCLLTFFHALDSLSLSFVFSSSLSLSPGVQAATDPTPQHPLPAGTFPPSRTRLLPLASPSLFITVSPARFVLLPSFSPPSPSPPLPVPYFFYLDPLLSFA
eukprot:794381-Rhodomonas_salina.2